MASFDLTRCEGSKDVISLSGMASACSNIYLSDTSVISQDGILAGQKFVEILRNLDAMLRNEQRVEFVTPNTGFRIGSVMEMLLLSI